MIGRARVAASVEDRRVAFERLAAGSLDRAYRLAGVILGSGADAEDATHDAVVQAWRAYPTLRDPARFDAWFQRILVNVCRDRLRRHRRVPVTELAVDGAPGPDGFTTVDDRLVLGRAFARLKPDQAITVVLRYYLDLSLEDVAIRTGVPVGTVKSRLHAAMAALHVGLDGTEVIDL